MSTFSLIAVDLLVAFLCVVAWLGAAITAATGRGVAARILTASAVAVTLLRLAVVLALAGRGWWFVQDKVTLGLPLVGLAGAVAAGVLVTKGVAKAVVPLFAAGFSATVGLILPLLWGYPQNAGQAMISLSLVGVATVAAWRFTSSGPVRAGRLLAPAIALGVAGVGLGFLPLQQVSADSSAAPITTDVASLRGPSVPAPGGSVRRFELAAQKATVTLASGTRTEAWTYNKTSPGPEIAAVEGDLLEVTLTNVDIESGVTLHWHGYDVPNAEDGAPGVTQEAVLPGGRHVYRFLANQVGTYWYHTHQVSSEGVRKGLFGTLIVKPRAAVAEGADLVLPIHTFDGEVTLGTPERTVPSGEPVRLRVINTDNTPHRITLAGTDFRVTAADGNDLHEPGPVSGKALRLAAGARYDLSFTMPGNPVALLVDDGLSLSLNGAAVVADTSGWSELDLLSYGTPAPTPFGPGSRFDRDFTLVLDRGLAMVEGAPMFAHTVNGLGYPNIPSQVVREGDLVRFTVVNRGIETHPWHLHGHRVLVLGARGSPLWLDTFDVRPGEVWRVAFRASNPGMWMNHCHNLDHAEQGMVLHLAYEGVGSTMSHAAH
ncbi:MAG TPA: multicopper oxidase family protein [Candidatus Limnocylindrales bacterium]